jgi:hypothetical protein
MIALESDSGSTEHGAWRTETTTIPGADILALDDRTPGTVLDSVQQSVEQPRAGRIGPPASGQPPPDLSSPVASRLFALLKKWIPSKGLIVKSRQGLFVFGEGLADELLYLQSVISQALISLD